MFDRGEKVAGPQRAENGCRTMNLREQLEQTAKRLRLKAARLEAVAEQLPVHHESAQNDVEKLLVDLIGPGLAEFGRW